MKARAARGLVASLLAFAPVWAHDFGYTDVVILLRPDRVVQTELTVDVDAIALGRDPSADSSDALAVLAAMEPDERQEALARAETYLKRHVRLRFDGEPTNFSVAFPKPLDSPIDLEPLLPSYFGTTARLESSLPDEAKSLTFFASASLRGIRLTIRDLRTPQEFRVVLAPGEESAPWPIDSAEPPNASRRAAVGHYLKLGFLHILPLGLDHVLFVVLLFLPTTRLSPLLWQVTAFTIAHSVSLALSIFDLISLPSRAVEPLIAVSIAWLALENLRHKEPARSRTALIFCFGLLHGLGFAGVLRELGLPEGQRLLALIAFNVGVEGGQIAVIAAAAVSIGLLRGYRWYRGWIVVPASAAIGALGLFWAVQRALDP